MKFCKFAAGVSTSYFTLSKRQKMGKAKHNVKQEHKKLWDTNLNLFDIEDNEMECQKECNLKATPLQVNSIRFTISFNQSGSCQSMKFPHGGFHWISQEMCVSLNGIEALFQSKKSIEAFIMVFTPSVYLFFLIIPKPFYLATAQLHM